ncbi:uncharacterized protein LOC116093032 [Mastomys coucha]|uniref:uncharacterized protein LOC116093032 n=1 Tax=Mastomys coucha TaxID=35658 RepID=UPI0012616720|nr:uncharacterized protein LOC116093032 [Mastomys coucha]
MPPPTGKKATSKTAKRPRDSSDSQSGDDMQPDVPSKPEVSVIVISDDDSPSSDQDDQQGRESAQPMRTELQGHLTQSYLAKRKEFHQDVTTSVDILNEKLVGIIKTQQRERKKLCSNYAKRFEPLFHQWEKDVAEVGQAEDNFVNLSYQHAEILYNTVMAQKATFDEAKTISDQFLKNIQALEDQHKALDAVEQNRLENELKNLKEKLVTENQHRDLAAIESCLHSLFSKDSEEDNL